MQRAYVDPGKRLVVFWSAKAACTTVAEWFFYSVLQKERAAAPTGARDYLFDNGHFLRPADVVSLYRKQPDIRSVAFVRDPWARCASAFASKFVLNYGTFITRFDQLEPFAKTLYRNVRGQSVTQAQADYQGLSFEEFSAYLNRANRLDHHWDVQYPPEYAETGIRAQTICDIRDMDAAMNQIETEFGLPHTSRRGRNKTAYTEKTGNLAAVSSLDLATRSTVPNKDALASDTAISHAIDFYRLDFEVFGYEYPAVRFRNAPPSGSADRPRQPQEG